jgi:hypothetical protein
MKSKESFQMNKTTAIHVASEIAVVGSLFVYLMNKISALEMEVAELKKDTQAVGAHQLRSEKSHTEAITELNNRMSGHNNIRSQPNAYVHSQPQPPQHNHNHAHAHQPQPTVRVRVPPTPIPPVQAGRHPRAQQPPPKVEVVDDQTEEELLESEFGDEQDEQEEQEEPEEEEAPPPRRGGRKAVTFIPTSKPKSATSMDDIKRRAAEMRARAGADE